MTTNPRKIPYGKHIKKFEGHIDHLRDDQSAEKLYACKNHFHNCGSKKTLIADDTGLYFVCSNYELSFYHIYYERESAFQALYPLLVEQNLLSQEQDESKLLGEFRKAECTPQKCLHPYTKKNKKLIIL